ncbi:MAG: sorbosone dehydrogenase family protein [Candidatus Dormibacteria bacterium]
MIGRFHPLLGVCIVAALSACGSATSTTTRPTPTATATHATPSASANPCAVTGQSPPPGDINADFATALAFAPDGRLFYAERGGTVRVWQSGASRAFATVQTVTSEPGGAYSERGLLGLTISPTFNQDRHVYAFYSDPNRTDEHVVRWTDCAGTGMNAATIITLPAGSDCCHKGGRLAFGSDGKLYVTLGDEHTSSAAQNTSDPRGKLLRYNPDGSVPSDNPFGASNPVWAYGMRNPFGIAVSSGGQIAITSNGPSGDSGSPTTGYDTMIENVTRGAHYQWPLCYGYSHPLAASSCDGGAPPDWSSEQATVVPTGMAFVDGSGPQAYAGHLVFCTFAGGMRIVTAGSPHASVSEGPSTCQLDVKEGPDHALYASDQSAIHRLT